MPPRDLAVQNLTFRIEPPGLSPKEQAEYREVRTPIESDRPWMIHREPFMICQLSRAVNEAVSYYKRMACVDGGNLAKNYTVYKDPSLS